MMYRRLALRDVALLCQDRELVWVRRRFKYVLYLEAMSVMNAASRPARNNGPMALAFPLRSWRLENWYREVHSKKRMTCQRKK